MKKKKHNFNNLKTTLRQKLNIYIIIIFFFFAKQKNTKYAYSHPKREQLKLVVFKMNLFHYQIDVLPEVIAETQGTNVEVYLDGGVRLGTDVLKALALGARAVFIGRPIWWGLTYKVRIVCITTPCCLEMGRFH